MGRGRYPGVEVHGGKVRISFQWRGRRCREALGLNATQANLKHAARVREEIRQKIRAGIFEYGDYFPDSPNAAKHATPTFRDLGERWLELQAHLAKSTLTSYRKTLRRHYYPHIGDTRVTEITYSGLAEVVAAIPWGSAKTRNNSLTPLRGVFEIARRDGVIRENPAAEIKPAKVQQTPPDPLTLPEVDAILEWMERHEQPTYRNFYEAAFFTGMRPSELIALPWGNVDQRSGLVRVDRAKVEGEIKSTKTANIRDIELNSRAAEALRRQKSLTYLAEAEVFHDPITGQPFNDDKPPRLVWDRALKALGIRRRVAYQTRHTFATLNLMAGANPMWVAQQLGHANMGMLLKRYSRWIQGADQSSERRKIDALLGQEWDTAGTNRGTSEGN